ncbi:MAG: MerR family transcriptional regulator [Nitriliruptorales bacterium]|nr:MerR family transcriptional regulator [Nitriliruptorales bacterium]
MSHTIGEVLNRLKDEFDDVTISKIRFLEAEGLINPDRTDSGYRQFTDGDVDRLRYILRAQRDRYLPLKVIKDELDRIDAGLPVDAPGHTTADGEQTDELFPDVPTPTPSMSAPATDVQLDLGELSDTSGLAAADLRQLQDHGLLPAEGPYTGEDLVVAKLARKLMEEGLEPRHLRMYRQFADRQVMLYQQLVSPLLRQRNPDSRKQAGDRLDELAEIGYRLQSAILTRELRSLLRP